jgi:hypothetical protein
VEHIGSGDQGRATVYVGPTSCRLQLEQIRERLPVQLDGSEGAAEARDRLSE